MPQARARRWAFIGPETVEGSKNAIIAALFVGGSGDTHQTKAALMGDKYANLSM
jgi:hypothetical protein